jgi:predicted amidohydrolase
MATVRIAFLHLAPCLRDLQANRRLIDRAVTTAATAGATWILTPELCICGYDFTGDLVHLRRSCYAIGPPMVDLGYETTSLYSTIDR